MSDDEGLRSLRFLGMGLEFAGSALVLGLVGWYIDRQLGTQPWIALVGFCVGFVGGSYLFFKKALEATRSSTTTRRSGPLDRIERDQTNPPDREQSEPRTTEPSRDHEQRKR